MRIEKNIVEYLKSLPQETICYYPNPGNGGDSLIAHATYQLFGRHKIKYRMASSEDDLRGKVIVYGGGGNLVEYYQDASRFIRKHHRQAKKLVILPHTINAHEALLRELGGNTDIICREETSYGYVKDTARKANVMLMDDLAFHIDVTETMDKRAHRPPSRSFYCDGRYLKVIEKLIKGRLKYGLYKLPLFEKKREPSPENPPTGSRKSLNCFRMDREKTGFDIPRDNLDLSKLFALGVAPEKVAHMASLEILRIISFFDEINTNRLHLCIAGLLLDKAVNFYPNSYYKNESVFKFSIKDKFPKVKWMG